MRLEDVSCCACCETGQFYDKREESQWLR
jgi:hypothetical protein